MKKLTAFILAVVVTALSFCIFTGCSDEETFKSLSYSSGDSEIKSVNIDVSDREVEVRTSSDSQVYIDGFESEKEYYSISVSEDGVLTMSLVQNKDFTDYIGKKSPEEYRKIVLKVPDSLVSNLNISTTNSKVTVSELTLAEGISLDVNGGDILIEKVNAGKTVSLTAKNGNISGTIIGSYDLFSIDCKIKKGDSNLPASKADGEKSLSVNCNNGDVNVEFAKE